MSIVNSDGVKIEGLTMRETRRYVAKKLDPEQRRKRGLAILALSECGFDERDLRLWFNISPRHLERILDDGEKAAQQLGLRDPSWRAIGTAGSAITTPASSSRSGRSRRSSAG